MKLWRLESPKTVECAADSSRISVSGLRQNFYSEKLQFSLLKLLRDRIGHPDHQAKSPYLTGAS